MTRILTAIIITFSLLGAAGTGAAIAMPSNKGAASAASGGKGAEHTSNKSPSKLEKHQKGQAAKAINEKSRNYLDYKGKGGNLSKSAWQNQGQPKK